MSRTLILTLAAAATITVASFASSASYARGGGGGHIGGGWTRQCRWPIGGGARIGGGRIGGRVALKAVGSVTPVTGVTAATAVVDLSAVLAGFQSSRTLDIPWRPLDRRRPGGGRCGFGRGARGSGRGSGRQLRTVHMPDQDLHAGRPRDVRGRLHQGSCLSAEITKDDEDLTLLLKSNREPPATSPQAVLNCSAHPGVASGRRELALLLCQ